ncbi:MAG: MlaE family ABC transporter permease [Solirubrobacteraceae bacterium]
MLDATPQAPLGARIEESVGESRLYESVEAASQMGRLLVAVLRALFSRPITWPREAITLYSTYARRIILPMIISVAGYEIGYAVFFFGGVTSALGVGERFSGALWIGTIRELGVWITTMVFAGVAGSAVAADLGARKIREELDALSVLGVKVETALALPRMVAMTVLAPTIGFVAIFVGNGCIQIVGPHLLDYPTSIGFYSIVSNIYTSDIVAFALKMTIVGVFVATVSCQKGLNCKPGAEGVGRAVHQTVVISFFGIWMINSLFNLAYLTLFPNTAILKG